MAAQLTTTNGPRARGDRWWMAWAISSFPLPALAEHSYRQVASDGFRDQVVDACHACALTKNVATWDLCLKSLNLIHQREAVGRAPDDGCEPLRHVVPLDEVVVGALLDGFQRRPHHRLCRGHDNRHAGASLADLGQGRQPVHIGHHQIKHHQVSCGAVVQCFQKGWSRRVMGRFDGADPHPLQPHG